MKKKKKKKKEWRGHQRAWFINPTQDGPFWGCSRMGSKNSPLPKICHTYTTMIKYGTVIPYLKKIQKIYESHDTLFEFCWHQHFFTEDHQILLYQEIQIYIAFWYIMSNDFNFFLSLYKDWFDKPGYNFDDVSKNSRPS